MSFFLAMAVFIIMVAAPFLVMAAVIVAIAVGLISLARGIHTARPLRAVMGALILTAGVVSGLTLAHWATATPREGDAWSAHALVHDAWKNTWLRFVAMKWMKDGTLERLSEPSGQQER